LIDIKPYIPKLKLIATILVISLAIWFFWSTVSDYILGIFGLGAAGAAVYASKSTKLQAEASEHLEQADVYLSKAAGEMKQSEDANKEAVDLANKPSEEPRNIPPGFKKTKISSK
jgi:ABC-type nickel/cobalt efflux system permease component RcnA